MRFRSRHRVISVALGTLSALLLSIPQSGAARSAPVVLAPVEITAQSTELRLVGTSEAIRSLVLYPEASGTVTQMHFQPGDRVDAGQTLVSLDERDERLAVALAKVQLRDAERLLTRYEASVRSGAVTASTLDETRSDADAARIETQRAELALDRRTVRAPFTGHIGLTQIHAGARIDTNTPIASLDDRSALLIVFAVPELFLDEIRVGQPLTLQPWNRGREPVSGQVHDIDSRIDPNTRSFRARAIVDNAEDRLRPGMSFRLELERSGEAFPTVPETALQWGGDGAYVWRVSNDIAERVPVVVVQRIQGFVRVDGALAAGDAVVIEGVHNVRPGQPVRVVGVDDKAAPP